jgi:membrane protease YdiL (CAAX protease family)
VAGIPLLLGILFYRGYKLNGTLSLKGILLYRQPIPFRQYAWLVPVLLVWTAIASTLLYFFAESLRQVLFSWWPTWLNLSVFAQNPTRYSSAVTWAVVILSAILNIAVPITEELYFRSYLLPRIPFGRIWSPLWSAVLFSLYHFWLPWDFFGRVIALLPIIYAVQWKQNVYLSILVHCLLNSLGTIGLFVLVLNSGG